MQYYIRMTLLWISLLLIPVNWLYDNRKIFLIALKFYFFFVFLGILWNNTFFCRKIYKLSLTCKRTVWFKYSKITAILISFRSDNLFSILSLCANFTNCKKIDWVILFWEIPGHYWSIFWRTKKQLLVVFLAPPRLWNRSAWLGHPNLYSWNKIKLIRIASSRILNYVEAWI